jgi:hypothetical protein
MGRAGYLRVTRVEGFHVAGDGEVAVLCDWLRELQAKHNALVDLVAEVEEKADHPLVVASAELPEAEKVGRDERLEIHVSAQRVHNDALVTRLARFAQELRDGFPEQSRAVESCIDRVRAMRP